MEVSKYLPGGNPGLLALDCEKGYSFFFVLIRDILTHYWEGSSSFETFTSPFQKGN